MIGTKKVKNGLTKISVVMFFSLLASCGDGGGERAPTANTAQLNSVPMASFSFSPTAGESPLEVEFDGSGSSDTDGNITDYNWDFGDGFALSGAISPSHTFDIQGTYTITLEVTDNDGAIDSVNATLDVQASVTAPFGLTERPSIAHLNLPGDGVALGSYQLVQSFPNLSFSFPVFLAGVPGENRLIVVQQRGLVRAFENNSDANSSQTILDLTSRLSTGNEEGILGLSFDPNFVLNRFVYIYYSAHTPRRSVISRFEWSETLDQLDPTTEKLLLEVPQPGQNHNAGMLAFGPDDFLYIALGDGGADSGTSQDLTSLLGSILRIDPHPSNLSDGYDIPLTNPFVGQPGVRDEIFAYGLRNPFRFSFDRQTGDLWLGDVGSASREEINLITRGGNYGWDVYEGTLPFNPDGRPLSNFESPLLEYDHSLGSAVIGGYVYRDNALVGLIGRYLYADTISATVWALEYDGTNVISNEVIASARRPSSFGEDNAGNIFVVDLFPGDISHFVESGSDGATIPDLLSETGVFSNIETLTPASGLIEYNVNHPLWSDNAVKRRWIGIPDATQIEFHASDAWGLPVGTVIVKHFEIELAEGVPSSSTRLETRLLINTHAGWQGFTYKWNAAGTEATLLSGRLVETLTISLESGETRNQVYEYPSRTDCLRCHTDAAGHTLGLRTAQMNLDFEYITAMDNQLRSWNHIQLFSTDIGDESQYPTNVMINDTNATIEERARTYLEVNCAQCHQPGGGTPVNIDLRASVADIGMNAIGEAPLSGDLGISGAQIISPGNRENSVLWQRMQRIDAERMPPIASHLNDENAVDVIGQWIDAL